MFIDRRNSSSNGLDADVRAGPMPATLEKNQTLHLHVFVDHSIVTVLVENQTALTVGSSNLGRLCRPGPLQSRRYDAHRSTTLVAPDQEQRSS